MSTSGKLTILVVEDEPQIRRFLRTSLAGQGYRILEAANGREGLSMAASHGPNLVILDLGLPDMDGLDIIREVRAWGNMPILVLTARGRERDKVTTLDAGADDYVTKPFGMAELTARMRVLLRHAATRGLDDPPAVTIGGLTIDLARRAVLIDGARVQLTPREYAILAVLTRARGKVVTHRQLLQEVWGREFVEQSHYVRIYLQRLRRKLEAIPARPRYLISEPGVGYRLVDE